MREECKKGKKERKMQLTKLKARERERESESESESMLQSAKVQSVLCDFLLCPVDFALS